MQIIYKYNLNMEGLTTVKDKFVQILNIQIQHGRLTMWAIVDDKANDIELTFGVFGTGWFLPYNTDEVKLNYLTTVQEFDGELIWHVFLIDSSTKQNLYELNQQGQLQQVADWKTLNQIKTLVIKGYIDANKE